MCVGAWLAMFFFWKFPPCSLHYVTPTSSSKPLKMYFHHSFNQSCDSFVHLTHTFKCIYNTFKRHYFSLRITTAKCADNKGYKQRDLWFLTCDKKQRTSRSNYASLGIPCSVFVNSILKTNRVHGYSRRFLTSVKSWPTQHTHTALSTRCCHQRQLSSAATLIDGDEKTKSEKTHSLRVLFCGSDEFSVTTLDALHGELQAGKHVAELHVISGKYTLSHSRLHLSLMMNI